MWLFANNILKRLMDVIISLVALILMLPIWIVVPVLIKCDSRGPVFFVQNRLTKDGKQFKMYKFRSMVENAENLGTGLFIYENDCRVTRVGNLLRNTSIDELPQLWNVLKGDISLVGPRPCVVYELGDYETLNKKYRKRFQVKGGITGLAQIKGRNENSWDEKVMYDNQYIDMYRKQGIWIDIKILFGTIVSAVKKQNILESKADSDMSDMEAAKFMESQIIHIAHLPDEDMMISNTSEENGK